MKHQYDVIIVGSGLAGLRAAVEIGKDAHVAVLTKVFATRSHSGAAQGGIGAALGNEEEDHWKMRPGPFMSWRTWGCHLIVRPKVKSPNALLVDIRAIMVKRRLKEPVMRQREPEGSF
jgi:flavin-dependent dehydrogenase